MGLLKRWGVIIVILIVIYVASGFFLSFLEKPDPHPLEGKKAPNIVAKKLDGTEVNLKDLVGKNLLVIDFWATWCGPCRRALPALEKLAKKYEPSTVSFYAVNVWDGNLEQINKFIRENKIANVNVLYIEGDSRSIGEEFKFKGIPAIFLIDSDLTVRCFFSGYSPSLEKILDKEIKKVLKEKEQVAQTR
ncbi:MAG: TlpA family protein disulfide reductase [Candidatus Hydrogenedentes bacterium]|nr:TlpA family protein disulfide reductase [Candidatus Hydrogenedentota bacterium]